MRICPSCHEAYLAEAYCPVDGSPLDGARLATGGPVAPATVGSIVDRYRLVRPIGEGGMSEVFEAEHIHLGRHVALKLLRRDLAQDAAAVERFRLEARTTSALGHPNVVRVVDSGAADDGSPYLAMEWLPGETLAARLERGPVAEDLALELIEQICDGLAAAHAAGVVHRDMKPGNVFLTADARGRIVAKILDFGIAKLVRVDGHLTRTGTFVGTPDYIAPEQALGEAVDGRADVYAVGVMLYELLTGTVPFRGDSFMAVIHAHTVQPPEPPSNRAPERGVWRELEQIVLTCLEKEPSRRFASVALLGAAVHEARGGSAGSFYERLRAAGTDQEIAATRPRDRPSPGMVREAQAVTDRPSSIPRRPLPPAEVIEDEAGASGTRSSALPLRAFGVAIAIAAAALAIGALVS